MKTLLIALAILFYSSFVWSQNVVPDSTINLDLLRSPSSPAFNLLGLSPSDIDRPSDVNAFAISLQNATKNFSSLPNSYAVELAPAYLFRKDFFSLDRLEKTSFKEVFWQSFTASIGYTRLDPDEQVEEGSEAQSKMGFGTKFSLIRPAFSAQTSKLYNDLVSQQKAMLDQYQAMEARNSLNKRANEIRKKLSDLENEPDPNKRIKPAKLLISELGEINIQINAETNVYLATTESYNKAKEIASTFKLERKGPFLDFAAGLVLDFPDDRFYYSKVTKGGAWVTGGYENGNKGVTVLGIARYLYQPDKIFADDAGMMQTKGISTLDGGAKILISGAGGRFDLSSEAIYRSVLTENAIDPSWRLVLNTGYDIGKNKKLTFAFGRNFDGSITKGGNLIAALNFISSFGSSRKISD